MTQVDRRTVLKAGAVAALAGPFAGFFAREANAAPASAAGPDLVGVPDLRDGEIRLALPRGFSYRSFQPTGEPLRGGATVPGRHDGMA
ncbi:MAG: hypothetical protein H0T40_00690, partial [Geodermatophilaceae bacterium]|nr:hypothetical protein [Geodermatophilaceae bacterium]